MTGGKVQIRVGAIGAGKPISIAVPAEVAKQAVAAIALAFVVAILASMIVGSATRADSIDGAEMRATADAAHIGHIFYYSVWAPIHEQVADATFAESVHPEIMTAFARRSTFGLSIVDLKAWSLDGQLLWSSSPGSSTATMSSGLRRAIGGVASSSYVGPSSYVDLAGMAKSGSLVRTWVPFYDTPTDSAVRGNLVGVLEVSRDVSGEISSGGFGTAWLASLSSFVAVLALWVAVWLYRDRSSHPANRLVRQQQQRIQTLEMQRTQTAKLATVGETVAGVAHEINNPLTTIWGLSQLALERELDETSKVEMQMIHDEAQRTAKIVQNLLSFARARESEMSYTSINAAVDAAVELRQYQLRVNNISISVETDPNLPRTMADPFKIQQVVLNLIVNAEQAIANTHKSGHITVRTETLGENIRLAVEDDGPGIPEDVRAKIFNPFFTTKAEGQGTGLGLSICVGIVQEHGGSISAEGQPNGGTAMVVELPITDQSGKAAKAASRSRR